MSNQIKKIQTLIKQNTNPGKEVEMFVYRQTAEQNVELRAQSHRGAHPADVGPY